MKHLILLFALFQAISIQAQPNGLNISSEFGAHIQVYINGRVANIHPMPTVLIGNLFTNVVDVTIVMNERSVLEQRVLLEHHRTSNFSFYLDEYGVAELNYISHSPYRRHARSKPGSNSRSMERRPPPRNCAQQHNLSNRIPVQGRRQAMAPAAIRELEIYLGNILFDRDRLSEARFALKGRRVTASQVAVLMHTFTFESNQVKFAKYAYQYTIDKKNYHRVKQAFTFSSSARELNNYIHQEMAYR
ncbi:DUF4476 domain-containing protein [Salibacteraceae bacterium]|nr:DUF4476 domain-containing protein [Salibacteraceae bacterium]